MKMMTLLKQNYSMTKEMLTVNISPKLIMTETCSIYKLYCKNHGNFLKINENIRNLYFKLAAMLNKVCLNLMLKFICLKWSLGS